MRFVKAAEQAADILTKGSFTEHTWYHLLDLIQIAPMKTSHQQPKTAPASQDMQQSSGPTNKPSNAQEGRKPAPTMKGVQQSSSNDHAPSTPVRKPKPAPQFTPERVARPAASHASVLAPKRRSSKNVSFDPVVSTQALGFLSRGIPLFQSFKILSVVSILQTWLLPQAGRGQHFNQWQTTTSRLRTVWVLHNPLFLKALHQPSAMTLPLSSLPPRRRSLIPVTCLHHDMQVLVAEVSHSGPSPEEEARAAGLLLPRQPPQAMLTTERDHRDPGARERTRAKRGRTRDLPRPAEIPRQVQPLKDEEKDPPKAGSHQKQQHPRQMIRVTTKAPLLHPTPQYQMRTKDGTSRSCLSFWRMISSKDAELTLP